MSDRTLLTLDELLAIVDCLLENLRDLLTEVEATLAAKDGEADLAWLRAMQERLAAADDARGPRLPNRRRAESFDST